VVQAWTSPWRTAPSVGNACALDDRQPGCSHHHEPDLSVARGPVPPATRRWWANPGSC